MEPDQGDNRGNRGQKADEDGSDERLPRARAEACDCRPDQDLERQQHAEFPWLTYPFVAITKSEPATPANAAETPNASVL